MFDFSMAETSLTLVIALLLIGPEELPGAIRAMRNVSRKSKQMFKEMSDKVMEIEGADGLASEVRKLNNDIKQIADSKGNLYDSYDMSDIMPEIEKAKKNKTPEEKSGDVTDG